MLLRLLLANMRFTVLLQYKFCDVRSTGNENTDRNVVIQAAFVPAV